jgi:hypothetical protein
VNNFALDFLKNFRYNFNTMKHEVKIITPPIPLMAILVSIEADKQDVQKGVELMKGHKASIQKIKVPSGPALINGQWW